MRSNVPVAQWIEHPPPGAVETTGFATEVKSQSSEIKRKVAGSSPAEDAKD